MTDSVCVLIVLFIFCFVLVAIGSQVANMKYEKINEAIQDISRNKGTLDDLMF